MLAVHKTERKANRSWDFQDSFKDFRGFQHFKDFLASPCFICTVSNKNTHLPVFENCVFLVYLWNLLSCKKIIKIYLHPCLKELFSNPVTKSADICKFIFLVQNFGSQHLCTRLACLEHFVHCCKNPALSGKSHDRPTDNFFRLTTLCTHLSGSNLWSAVYKKGDIKVFRSSIICKFYFGSYTLVSRISVQPRISVQGGILTKIK